MSEAFSVINCWISDDEDDIFVVKRLYALCIMPKIIEAITLITDWLNQLSNVKNLIINILECIITFMKVIEVSIEQLNKSHLTLLLVRLLDGTNDEDILSVVSKCLFIFTDENPRREWGIISLNVNNDNNNNDKGNGSDNSNQSLSRAIHDKIIETGDRSFFPALCESFINLISATITDNDDENNHNDGNGQVNNENDNCRKMIQETWSLLIANFKCSEQYLESLSNVSVDFPCRNEKFLMKILKENPLSEHLLVLIINNLISGEYSIELLRYIWDILLLPRKEKKVIEIEKPKDIINAKVVCLRTVLQAAFEAGYEELYIQAKEKDNLLKASLSDTDTLLNTLWIILASTKSLQNVEYYRRIFMNINVEMVKDREAYDDVGSILEAL